MRELTHCIPYQRAKLIFNRRANHSAQLQNTYLTTAHDSLMPLVKLTDGTTVTNMPATPAEINRLSGEYLVSNILSSQLKVAIALHVKNILAELGVDVQANHPGGINALRRKLRIQFGLRGERLEGA